LNLRTFSLNRKEEKEHNLKNVTLAIKQMSKLFIHQLKTFKNEFVIPKNEQKKVSISFFLGVMN
jgi:hypothetical protein